MYSESTCDVIYKHQRKFNAQIVRQKIKWESFLYMKCDGNSGWLRGNFWFYTHMYFQLVIVRNGNFFFFLTSFLSFFKPHVLLAECHFWKRIPGVKFINLCNNAIWILPKNFILIFLVWITKINVLTIKLSRCNCLIVISIVYRLCDLNNKIDLL